MVAGGILQASAAAILGRSPSVSSTGVMPAIERGGVGNPGRANQAPRRIAGGRLLWAQEITVTSSTPVMGDPITVPSGAWLAQVAVSGDWDAIYGALEGGSGGDWGEWLASRPDGSGRAGGRNVAALVSGGDVITPGAAVHGTGSGDVGVTVTLEPQG